MRQPLTEAVAAILRREGWDGEKPALVVSSGRMHMVKGEGVENTWPVSTGAKGFGCQDGSGMTPTGLHRICAKIGAGAPLGMRFVGREATGEIVQDDPPAGDFITSRILWLEGLEQGHNRGTGVDSRLRYIYIHGTPHARHIGRPVSHGCVRMRNEEVIALFDLVEEGTLVLILPN